jgi:hypothetical protein
MGGSAGAGGAPAAAIAGPQPARRLTLLEYQNTLHDLVGYDLPPASRAALPDAWNGSGFPTGAVLTTGVDVRNIVAVAEGASRRAVQDLSILLPPTCLPPPDAAAETACASRFAAEFGLRAFRRPLDQEEIAALQAIYTAERAAPVSGTFTDGIRVVIAAMLQSPSFLYRWELAGAPIRDGALVRFGPYELASRLSYFLWSTMPDPALFAAAGAGLLSNPDDIEAQARRLLADPRARSTMTEFHLWWLHLVDLPQIVKDSALFPTAPALLPAMLDETTAFVTALMNGPGATGKLDALLTSSTSFVTPELAALYGVPNGPQPAQLDPTQRAGILTQGAFLARHANADISNPALRGQTLLEQVLCLDLKEPQNVDIPAVPSPSASLTTRKAFESQINHPCASACHIIYDAGFAFENYDSIGAYRRSEPGGPVDASGTLHLFSGDLSFTSAIDLVHALVGRGEVTSCLPRQWLRFLTRRLDGPGDLPSLDAAGAAFRRSSYDMREILVALTRSRAFTHRAPSAGEVMP